MSKPPSYSLPQDQSPSLIDKIPGLSQEDVTIEQINALMSFENHELSFTENHGNSYLILGAYQKPMSYRLDFLKDRLNQQPDTSAQVLMKLLDLDELPDVDPADVQNLPEEDCQFHLLANKVDAIVMLAENKNAGSAVELGDLTPTSGQPPDEHPYFQKTYICRRDYSNLSPEDLRSKHPVLATQNGTTTISSAYSRPQESKFTIFDNHNRYYTWESRPDLIGIAETIHNDV